MDETKNEVTQSRGMDISLVDIFRLLIAELHWLIISGVVVGIGVFLITTFVIAPKYESYITLYIYNNRLTNYSYIENGDLLAAESLTETYAHIFTSKNVYDSVVNELAKQGIKVTRHQLKELVDVRVVDSTQFLQITATSTDKTLSYNIAAAFEQLSTNLVPEIAEAGIVKIVDQAEVATSQSSPRVLFSTALGVVAGVMLAALFWVLRTLLDTTLYISDDIKSISDVAVLGQVPEIDVIPNTEQEWNITEGGYIYANRKDNAGAAQ